MSEKDKTEKPAGSAEPDRDGSRASSPEKATSLRGEAESPREGNQPEGRRDRGQGAPVGVRLAELAERGEQWFKIAAEKVEQLASGLSETARLKLELRSLESELNFNYRMLGKEIWQALAEGQKPPFEVDKIVSLLKLLKDLNQQRARKQEALNRLQTSGETP